ncbi:AM-toxin synthetase AMT1 [Pseudocercospora fuligena]|uniref:AM-toxin synthetase AMT1 n=1 Tax=Pseudocercospora fuligena TaxID=685502 RepID=A0A8H6RBX3_9PEZI|nr:AM-toxin synthetase AMT1 [Pseudocercospora fuligena]
MILTPTVARLLDPATLTSLTSLILTGEPLQQNDIDRWAHLPYLANAYGPAECSNMCAVQRLPHGSDPCVFGRLEGVPNWVVCAHDVSKLCPIGGVGELLIEGPTVGSGYLNNPEKTAQVFISDLPWLIKGASGTDEDGRRGTLYRTGDLVRLDEHGRLCYIGRRDAQIKIRGQRLELGEVAHHVAACLQTPNVVIDLFATCPDNGEPVERLIAFVVRSSSASHETPRLLPHADHIVEKLVDTLPAYMIPYAYIEVSHMPKTLSGKRDVKRLRALAEELLAPTTQSHAQNRPVRLPRTRMEQLLQRSWKQALGSKAPDVIGLDDNFVKLGGDSITAMKLVSLARRLSLRLDVGNILWNRTLEQQARHVETSGAQELPVLEARAYSLLPSDCDLSTVLLEVADACRCEKEFIEDLYPCTPAQEGLLAITTMHETTDMKPYVLQHVFDIPATVDMQRLCRAWETIVQRTHILRTRIVNHKRLGLLQVLIKEDVRWHEIENIDQFLMADKGASMDLGGLLVRFAISRTSCSRGSKLVWTIHHALADGTTLELVLQRVFDQYQNPDQTCPVAEFRPFVAYLGQLDRAGTVQYWTKMLHAVTNTPFPALPSTINYPVEDSEVVRDCTLPTMINGASHGFPFSVLVKSAWAIVQSRHSSSTDVVFGEVLSGRNAAMPLIDTLVGPSMVTLPFRTDLRRSQTVHDLLKNVQDAALSTIPHEQIGLQEIARINDDCSAACSFQTLLIVQPELALEDRIDRPPAFLASPSYKLATYALGIEVTPRSSGQQGCRIRCRYDSHAVSHPLAERLVAQLANVMVQLVTSTSDSLLTRISVLPLDELARLWEFNVRDDFHDLTSISDTIGRHVCRSPSAQAIRAWDGELTYVELDRLSEGLAGQLRALSNSQAQGQDGNQNQQTYIALCFERSLWMTVALVAVLKAGFAAVPLDVAHPESRIRKMLARLGPSGTILASKHQKRAKTFPDNWISHEVSAETITCKPREEWAPKALEYNSGMPRADADCFVLFTSGSTGEPKGVALQYRAIFSNLSRLIHTLGIDHATGVLQYSSHAFDAAMFENLGALLAGGCLCIPSEQQRLESLADFCNQSGVNFAMLTPSVARIYQPKDLACLKSLVLIGETPRAEDIYRWQGLDVEIWNGYGPTEASFLVALHRYDLTKDKDFSPYLGRVPRVPLWLVNCTGNDTLAPLGAVGEIWIEDVSNVARAYKGDRDQTANSFVENPLWLAEGVPGRVSGRSGRLYKTGDLAWQAENGDLMFVGRKDTQIKFRGQRIELAEIESRLLSCAPSATEVVVENLPYGKGQHKADTLVAFIRTLTCPDQAETFAPLQSARAVEEELRKHLPTYMVPKFFVSVRDIPQTTTGKTDRKRLRREGLAYLMVMSGPDRTSNLPLTPIESTLRCLWAQVLDIDEGSITRMGHFFALGGDSIRAMRLVYSFRNMQLGLTAADIFKYPHLYEQAQRLAGCTASELVSTGLHGDAMLSLLPTAVDPTKLRDSIAQTCKVHPSSIEDIYPCTPMQEGLMAITFQSPGAYTLRLKFDLAEDVNLDRLRAAWERTIASTAILRTRIVYDPLCGFVQVALPLVIWDWKEVEKEALVQPSPTGTGQPFSHWALIRHSTQNARGRACLIWTIHHSLYDQITLNLILTMLVSGYRQEALTPRPPYSSFIRSILAARSMEADEFWRLSLMNNASTIFPCPVGPRSLTPFDEDVFEMTCDLPPRTGNRTTIAILLRAAWAIVAGWHTSNTDVVFGDLRSGRAASIPDIDSIPGPTIATIPFRIVLDPSEPIHTFLDRVHSIYAKSIEFEQTGLSRISKISDDCARACRFETLLALQAGASPRASSMHGSNEIWREVRVEDFAMRTYSLLVECWVESAGSLSVKATRNVNVCSSMLVKTLLHQFTAVASQLIMHTRDSNSDKVVGDIESPEPDDWHGFTSRTEQHRGQQWLVSVDNHDRLAPLGTIGELLLEDETVTENLSYPSQTQYVERPQFLAKANARPSCVLTGILARYDEDAGSMRCIGRKSELVTTDGTIVDPAPIESLIRSATESCTQAVVTLLPSSPHDGLGGKQRLAAFLCFTSPFLQPSVPEPGSMRWYADAAAVQHQLSKWLPQHLLPSQYLQLDWLPQGVWGGPDRTSLAELGGAHIARYGDQQNTTLLRHQPPVSSSQLAMAELWSGLLEIPTDTLSLDDNFFDLGADSVTAMALVARARKRNVKLTVAGVLRHPTLEGMTACAIFDEVNGLPKADPFSLFTGSSVDEPLDLESLMQRDIIPHLNYDRCAVADVLPCTAMQSEFLRMGGVYYNIEIDLSDVKIDLRRMQRAVNLLIDRHSILRTIFLSPGKEFLQVVLHPGSADLFRVLEIAPSHDDAVVTAGSISELPLFELVMDDRDTTMGHAKLAIRGLSHARFDGYSLPFILRDLAMLYDGHDDSLPPAAQFTSFVYYTASISAGMALEYWSRHLDGACMNHIPHLSAPSIAVGQEAGSTSFRSLRVVLPFSDWEQCCEGRQTTSLRKQKFSSDTVLVALWAVTLAVTSASNDVLFGHTVLGRFGIPQLPGGGAPDSVLGPCVNTVPLRVRFLDTGPEQTFQELLEHITRLRLASTPFESSSIEAIVNEYTSSATWPGFAKADCPWDGARYPWGSTVVWQDFHGLQQAQHDGLSATSQGAVTTGVGPQILDPFEPASTCVFAGRRCALHVDLPQCDSASRVSVIGRQVMTGPRDVVVEFRYRDSGDQSSDAIRTVVKTFRTLFNLFKSSSADRLPSILEQNWLS